MSNYEERLTLDDPEARKQQTISELWRVVDEDYPTASMIGKNTDILGWTTQNDVKWNFDSGQSAWQILAVLVLCAEGEIE